MRHRMHLLLALVLLAAGCGTGSAPSSRGAPRSVSVAYAGSLAYENDQVLGPAFTRRTGIAYLGRGGGSWAIAQELNAGVISADVFESVGVAPIASLGPSRASWAVSFATSPLVVAYNPKSRFAPRFLKIEEGRLPLRDLFSLLTDPALRLGRTNPAVDPQGRAFYLMVELAQKILRLPAGTAARILGSSDNPREVFSEEGLPTQLEAGGLDAASAYLPQARQHHLAYIVLPPTLDFASPRDLPLYRSVAMELPGSGKVRGQLSLLSVTVLHGGQGTAGDAFVRFILSRGSARLWQGQGYRIISPEVWGRRGSMPTGLLAELKGSRSAR